LKRLPRRASVHRYPLIGRFAARLRAPYFWTWSGWPLVASLYAAMVLSWLPLMGAQIPIALALAVVLRANLPLAVGLQFISNPITAAPLYGLTTATGWWPAGLVVDDAGVALHTTVALTIGGVIWGLVAAAVVHVFHVYRTRRHREDLHRISSLTT